MENLQAVEIEFLITEKIRQSIFETLNDADVAVMDDVYIDWMGSEYAQAAIEDLVDMIAVTNDVEEEIAMELDLEGYQCLICGADVPRNRIYCNDCIGRSI